MQITIQSLQFEQEVKQATVTYIYVAAGDTIKKGDDIIELATEKSVFVVPSPVDGTVQEIEVEEGQTVHDNTVLMVIE